MKKHLLRITAFITLCASLLLISCGDGGASSETATYFDPASVDHAVYGEGFGLMPGRVAYARDESVFSWDGTGKWWNDKNFDTARIDVMVKETVKSITGKDTMAGAWDALFRSMNTRRYNDDRGYTDGEKIAVKLNMNNNSSMDLTTNGNLPTPAVLASLLKSLVNDGGVPASAITLYDVTRVIPTYYRDYLTSAGLSGVQYVDINSQNLASAYAVEWSETIDGATAYIPQCVYDASYLINYANMKKHTLAGFTATAKNHFGSIVVENNQKSAPSAAGLHQLICESDYTSSGGVHMTPNPYGSYNPLVDIIANWEIGQKTFLYFIDAITTTAGQNATVTLDSKWQSLGNEWPCMIFASQDPLAIDSVAMDFLLSEPSMQLDTTAPMDNYLIEAASAKNPPSGTVYTNGFGDAVRRALGVHEHWYDAETKEYSRNKGAAEGIELYTVTLPD